MQELLRPQASFKTHIRTTTTSGLFQDSHKNCYDLRPLSRLTQELLWPQASFQTHSRTATSSGLFQDSHKNCYDLRPLSRLTQELLWPQASFETHSRTTTTSGLFQDSRKSWCYLGSQVIPYKLNNILGLFYNWVFYNWKMFSINFWQLNFCLIECISSIVLNIFSIAILFRPRFDLDTQTWESFLNNLVWIKLKEEMSSRRKHFTQDRKQINTSMLQGKIKQCHTQNSNLHPQILISAHWLLLSRYHC